jgi:hypothetical protein
MKKTIYPARLPNGIAEAFGLIITSDQIDEWVCDDEY